VVGRAALGACSLGSTRLQVAALAGGAGRVLVQHAGGGVAAGVGALLQETTVALLTGLHEVVAAHRTVEQPKNSILVQIQPRDGGDFLTFQACFSSNSPCRARKRELDILNCSHSSA